MVFLTLACYSFKDNRIIPNIKKPLTARAGAVLLNILLSLFGTRNHVLYTENLRCVKFIFHSGNQTVASFYNRIQ